MKTFFIKSIFSLFLVSVFGISSFGQSTGGPLGGSAIANPNGTPAENYCNFGRSLNVYLTNLNLQLPLGQDSEEYLPERYPEMYLRYSIDGGPLNIVQLSTFEFHDQVGPIKIYKASLNFYFNYCDECRVIDDSDAVYHTYTMELLTPNLDPLNIPGNYIPYPACDFSEADDIFSCQIFYNAAVCETSFCDNMLLTSYSHQELICGIPQGQSITENPDNDLNDLNPRPKSFNDKLNDINISVTPNPFNDQFKIEWSENIEVENIVLYDSSGRQIKTWVQNDLTGHSFVYSQTNYFTPGIYFIKLTSSDSTKVVKLIKQ